MYSLVTFVNRAFQPQANIPNEVAMAENASQAPNIDMALQDLERVVVSLMIAKKAIVSFTKTYDWGALIRGLKRARGIGGSQRWGSMTSTAYKTSHRVNRMPYTLKRI